MTDKIFNNSNFELEHNRLDKLDVNNLFQITFSYNIDVLKQAIEALIINQKYTNQRLALLEQSNIQSEEKIEKQQVKNEIFEKTNDHIHNYFGGNSGNEEFKKSLEELRKQLKEIEKVQLEKIEKKVQKQREDLQNTITNVYNNSYPSKEDTERKEEVWRKRFEGIDKEIFLLKEKINSGFTNDVNLLKKTSNKDKENNLEKNKKVENNENDLKKSKRIESGKSSKKIEGKNETKEEFFDKSNDKFDEENDEYENNEENSKKDETETKGKKEKEKMIINKRFNQFDTNLSEIIMLKQEIKDINELLGQQSFNMSMKNLIDRVDKLEKLNDDFSHKINDFNIFELFMGKNKNENGDEKFKKSEDEIYKVKHDLTNAKLSIENQLKSLNELKNLNLKANEDLENKIKSEISNLNDKFKEMINIQISGVYTFINGKLEGLPIENSLHISSNALIGEDESDRQKKGEFIFQGDEKTLKRIAELEKAFKILNNKLNLTEKMSKDISVLQEGLNTKASKIELNEIKEIHNQNTNQVNFLRDNFIQLMEDRKVFEEVSWLKKRIDMISSSLASLKPSSGDESNVNMSRVHLESYRFLETTVFNEFQKWVRKELEGLTHRLDDTRNILEEEVQVNLKKKADSEELKSLEEFLIGRLEELKSASTKKFADKNEINKSIRYLDSQVKHILDVYIKKIEKGDNWLLAKKPFNGHVCASCEQPIGELHDNSQFVPWNKMHPQQNDRIYRIGSGFSKMLQNLNLEPDENENKQLSRNRSNNHHAGLPRVQSFRNMTKIGENSMDMTNVDNFKNDNTLQEIYDDPNKPKVVKIYKVKKEKKDEK